MTEPSITKVEIQIKGQPSTLARLHLNSGVVQVIRWSSLKAFWSYAKPKDIEHFATSVSGSKLVCCATVASGQAGVIGVWDSARSKWQHVSEGAFAVCAMLVPELLIIISLHYVWCWGVPGHHLVMITPVTGDRDAGRELSVKFPVNFEDQGFDPAKTAVTCSATCAYSANPHGPLGIFWSENEGRFFVHDAGNLATFTMPELRAALKANDAAQRT